MGHERADIRPKRCIIAGLSHKCATLLESSAHLAAGWLQYLVEVVGASSAHGALGFELLTWWSDADYMPASVEEECYSTACGWPHGDAPFCRVITAFRTVYKEKGGAWTGELVLKEFGTMGLRDYDLKPRAELMKVWQQLRQHAAGSASYPQVRSGPGHEK